MHIQQNYDVIINNISFKDLIIFYQLVPFSEEFSNNLTRM